MDFLLNFLNFSCQIILFDSPAQLYPVILCAVSLGTRATCFCRLVTPHAPASPNKRQVCGSSIALHHHQKKVQAEINDSKERDPYYFTREQCTNILKDARTAVFAFNKIKKNIEDTAKM